MDFHKHPATSSIPKGMEIGLGALASRVRQQHFAKGALIIEEGDAGSHLYILLEGRVKAYSVDADGREITYAVYDAMDYFGEMVIDGGVRSASVAAVEPCLCAVVSMDELIAFVQQDSTFALHLIKRTISRSRVVIASARSMALESAYQRLVRILEQKAGGRLGSEPVVLSEVSHQSLAGWIGTSREMVTRLLNDLEKGGFVEIGVRRIVLLKKLPARW